jgi:predicted ribosomally synthesized peptide with SipW-like signal peptide
MALAGLLSLVYTAFAYFDDTEESADNSFTVGVWALEVEDGDGLAAVEGRSGSAETYTFKGLEVGASGTRSWAVTNTGTVPAYVDMRIGVTGDGTGHLGNYIGAHIYVSGSAGSIYNGPLSSAGGSYDLNLLLAGGQGKVIVLDWYVSDGYTTPDKNDVVNLTVRFSIQPTP